MRQLSYLAVLAGCLLGTLPLELVLRVRVYARWRRLLAALIPGLVLGVTWDQYAVRNGHWHFDPRSVIGVNLAGLPVEEVLFFLVIPTCAILTLEAVARRRPGWLIGDEPAEPVLPDDPAR
ncbi:MAG TPA: lycopene cyclase domain-containing protein [Jatrophihabitans sp.]|uniref:lycopene cyclase domain-containing protein n=1 Tax=Jatrophihabitans sp. TaxID=1932789 RepID=UPI002EED413E